MRQPRIVEHCSSGAAGGFAVPVVVGNTGAGSQEWLMNGRGTGGGQLVGVRRGWGIRSRDIMMGFHCGNE